MYYKLGSFDAVLYYASHENLPSIYIPEMELTAVFLVKTQIVVLIFDTELSGNIFAFGNCYDEKQYKNYTYFVLSIRL